MTKGQKKAFVILFNFCQQNKGIINWQTIVEEIKNSKCRVKNWLTIRSILQYFKDENFIERTKDLKVEEYKVTDKGECIAFNLELAEFYQAWTKELN